MKAEKIQDFKQKAFAHKALKQRGQGLLYFF